VQIKTHRADVVGDYHDFQVALWIVEIFDQTAPLLIVQLNVHGSGANQRRVQDHLETPGIKGAAFDNKRLLMVAILNSIGSFQNSVVSDQVENCPQTGRPLREVMYELHGALDWL
jgi:hypothetical protein